MVKPELELSLNSNTITLSWNEQKVVKKNLLQYSTDGSTWTKLSKQVENVYIHKDLTYRKTYYYRVKAYDGKSWSKYSNIVSKKIIPAKVKLF